MHMHGGGDVKVVNSKTRKYESYGNGNHQRFMINYVGLGIDGRIGLGNFLY